VIPGLNQMLTAIYRALDLAALRETRVGIKPVNQLLSSSSFEFFASKETSYVPANELYLGIDGMRDEYTLLGVQLSVSPHFDLMSRLQEGRSVEDSQYVRRMTAGTLDFRPARRSTGAAHLRDTFRMRADAISAGNVSTVKVVRAMQVLTIIDGKHTAALLAALNRAVPCMDVTPVMHDSYIAWIQRKMRRNSACYTKHLQFFAGLTSGGAS
jgi:hypothetical protein